MWIKRSEYQQLIHQAAQYEFVAGARDLAEARAEEAEERLQEERQAKDWMVAQLTSRFITKQGSYGLDHEPPKPPAPNPKGYTHDPSVIDLAKLEYYKKCARDAGRPEEEGEAIWEAEMRGESLPIEMDTEQ